MLRLEEDLRTRISRLNGHLRDVGRAMAELETFRIERAMRMDQIAGFESLIAAVNDRLDRGTRVRVVTEPRVPEVSETVPMWPSLGIGAGVFALLGVIVEIVRR